MWYADPSGANEIAELRCAGFTVRKGDNKLCSGIAAVSARLQNETLCVLEGRCPNLLTEASLYCYDDAGGENPVDKNNHALAALRYLISRLDARHLARGAKEKQGMDAPPPPAPRTSPDWDDERYWISLN